MQGGVGEATVWTSCTHTRTHAPFCWPKPICWPNHIHTWFFFMRCERCTLVVLTQLSLHMGGLLSWLSGRSPRREMKVRLPKQLKQVAARAVASARWVNSSTMGAGSRAWSMIGPRKRRITSQRETYRKGSRETTRTSIPQRAFVIGATVGNHGHTTAAAHHNRPGHHNRPSLVAMTVGRKRAWKSSATTNQAWIPSKLTAVMMRHGGDGDVMVNPTVSSRGTHEPATDSPCAKKKR